MEIDISPLRMGWIASLSRYHESLVSGDEQAQARARAWLSDQRRRHLDLWQEQLLDEAIPGWRVDVRTEAFRKRVRDLPAWSRVHRRFPTEDGDSSEERKLGTFLSRQRARLAQQDLDPDRLRTLDAALSRSWRKTTGSLSKTMARRCVNFRHRFGRTPSIRSPHPAERALAQFFDETHVNRDQPGARESRRTALFLDKWLPGWGRDLGAMRGAGIDTCPRGRTSPSSHLRCPLSPA